MIDTEILKKAIEKAVKNGWDCPCENHKEEHEDNINNWGEPVLITYQDSDTTEVLHIEDIIFSHSFAKAFWGEEHKVNSFLPDYLYHLQQMVLAEDPIKYLERFI